MHQHVWPPALVEALRARRHPPRLDGWTLLLDGEPPYQVDPADHDAERRAALEPDLDLALVSLSSPLGIESLPPEEAAPLLDAWHAGCRELPDRFRAWDSVSLLEPDLSGLRDRLQRGEVVGLQLPATALLTPAAVEAYAEVLAVCAEAGRPVLVHPGPATGVLDARLPGWWAAVVDYPAQLQAAWWSWQVAGPDVAPGLRICFVAGAGLAPVHHERLSARSGRQLRLDPATFMDTSSYGRSALDALVRVVGIDALVLGSDRPYAVAADPVLGAAASHAIRCTNPHRLLEGGQP